MEQSAQLSASSVQSDAATALSPWVIGVDPGLKGAIAAIRLDLSEYKVWRMPILAKGIDVPGFFALLENLKSSGGIVAGVLEKAQVMRFQGVSSALTIGTNYGLLVAGLELAHVPFEEILPSYWKKAVVGTTPRKKAASTAKPEEEQLENQKKKNGGRTVEDKKAAKELALVIARRMFPSLTFSSTEDGPAEALLMAEAARRMVTSGSFGVPAFSTPAEAQAVLDFGAAHKVPGKTKRKKL